MKSGPNAVFKKVAVDKSETEGSRGRKPNTAVFAVFLCGTLAFLDLYCTQPLLPLLSRVFRASEASVGLTVSASTFGVAISAALLALFGERMDRKRTIVGSMVALAMVTGLTATAANLEILAIWRFLQGILTPGIFIITIAYVTEEWAAELVPRVMSVYVAGTVFGGFLGRVSGGLLSESYGWRVMFLILGIAGLAGAMFTQRLLKPAVRREAVIYSGSRLAPMLENLRNARLLATFAIGFCMLYTLVSMFSYVTFYLAGEPFRLSTAELSWLFSVYLVGLVATLCAGTILSRIGLLHGILGAVALCLAGEMATLVPALSVVGLGLALVNSGVFISQTCANSFLRDAAPAGGRVSAAGLYTCSYYIGGTIGGIFPGLIWSRSGWVGCVTVTSAVLVMAGALAFFGWRQRREIADPIRL